MGYIVFSNAIENELLVYFKLLFLFYADDCVIMAESAEELQNAVNELNIYCFEWKLTVNVDKTKISIFSKGPMLKIKFYYNNLVLESVRYFKYLGAVFSRTDSFCKTKNISMNRYVIIKKYREFNLPCTRVPCS